MTKFNITNRQMLEEQSFTMSEEEMAGASYLEYQGAAEAPSTFTQAKYNTFAEEAPSTFTKEVEYNAFVEEIDPNFFTGIEKLQQLDLSILLCSDGDKIVLLRRYEEQARILKINSGKQFLACIRGEWMQGSFVVLQNSDGHVPWVNLPNIIFSPAGTRQDHHPSGHKFKERNGWEGLWEILRSPPPPKSENKEND